MVVKRLLKAKKEQDVQDFLNEIIVISNIKHWNLVQLKGCCIKGDQQILVYELVDNKDLGNTLWGNSNEGQLNWQLVTTSCWGLRKVWPTFMKKLNHLLYIKTSKVQTSFLTKI